MVQADTIAALFESIVTVGSPAGRRSTRWRARSWRRGSTFRVGSAA